MNFETARKRRAQEHAALEAEHEKLKAELAQWTGIGLKILNPRNEDIE